MDLPQNFWETDERDLVEGSKHHHQIDGDHTKYFLDKLKILEEPGGDDVGGP